MKNKIFLFSCVVSMFFALPASFSQVGLKAGIGLSDIVFAKEGQIPYLGYEGNLLSHRVPLLTYQVGVTGTFDLNRRFSFQSEILYVTNGLDYRSDFLYDDVTYKITIHYLQVPFLLRLNTAVRKEKYSGLYLGPYVAWKLRANKVAIIEGEEARSVMSNVKVFDLGAMLGYSFDIHLPEGDLVIGFRISYSLLNMMEPIDGFIPWYYGPEEERARNVSNVLCIGYRFARK